MAQTTDAIAFVGAEIEYSTDFSVWTSMAGFTNAVTVGGGDRNYGEYFTADGDTPIVKAGKRTGIDLAVDYAYTEGASDPFKIALAQYETDGGGQFHIRFSPKGGASTEYLFTCDENNTVLVHPGYPQGAVEPGDIVANQIKLRTAKLVQSAVA